MSAIALRIIVFAIDIHLILIKIELTKFYGQICWALCEYLQFILYFYEIIKQSRQLKGNVS